MTPGPLTSGVKSIGNLSIYGNWIVMEIIAYHMWRNWKKDEAVDSTNFSGSVGVNLTRINRGATADFKGSSGDSESEMRSGM